MEEIPALFSLFGKEVDVYTVFIWAAVLLGLIVFFACSRKCRKRTVILTAVLSVPVGLLCARLVYMLVQSDMIGFESFFRAADPEENFWGSANGASLWGAFGGVALAAWAASVLTGGRTADTMDALAPAAALTIAVSRFGEYFIGEGSGPYAEAEWTHFFPLAAPFPDRGWQFAVFFLEGLTALAIFVILLVRRGKLANGYLARNFVILYASCQVLLERLREEDNHLIFITFFLRFSQVMAVPVLLALMICAMRRRKRRVPAERTPARRNVICFVGFFLTAGVCVALEYAMDKSAYFPLPLLYILELACCVGFGLTSSGVIMKN